MIKARDICKSFGEKSVLRGVSRDFASRSVTCVAGPSGCGKTTFLNILMGILAPDSGVVSGMPKKKAAVFQDDRLLDSFTVMLNATVAMDAGYSRDDARAHLEILGLSDSLFVPACGLSGGMKKRLGIARAVLSNPEVLFLDEPFNGVDAEGKLNACRYIKRFCPDSAIIMVTHSQSEALMMGAEIFDISGGGYELDEGAVKRD